MSTRFSSSLYTTVRRRLLNFAPVSGSNLSVLLGNRIYQVEAPANPTVPYAVITFLDRAIDGSYNPVRDVIFCEVQFYHSSRSQMPVLEDIADTADAALLRWRDATSGLIFSRERTRATLPPDPDPHHRAEARVRCVYTLITWPKALTIYES